MSGSIFNYYCPIKHEIINRVRLEHWIYGVRVCFIEKQAPLVKKRRSGWCSRSLGKDNFPFSFRIIEQTVKVHIIHKGYSNHCSQTRETPWTSQSLAHHHKQQIGNKGDPYLDLDGVCALAIEVFKGKVLFELLEKQFYLPAFTVDRFNMASDCLLLASASVLRPILKLIPRCESLRVSARSEVSIYRNESKRIITA